MAYNFWKLLFISQKANVTYYFPKLFIFFWLHLLIKQIMCINIYYKVKKRSNNSKQIHIFASLRYWYWKTLLCFFNVDFKIWNALFLSVSWTHFWVILKKVRHLVSQRIIQTKIRNKSASWLLRKPRWC